MKKLFKYYLMCWLAGMIMFNAITLTIANETIGIKNLHPGFWIGYGFTTIIFICNLVVSFYFFNEDNKNKVFLNYPVIRISYLALFASLVVGLVSMSISAIPYWIGIILDVLILGFYVISISKSVAASEAISEMDKQIKVDTAFVRTMTADANSLISAAETPEMKKLTQEIYEDFRYSETRTVPEVSEIEDRIRNVYLDFSNAVFDADLETATRLSKKLKALIISRNNQVRVLK